MAVYKLKYDYYIGYNHKLYREDEIVKGKVCDDGRVLEVKILVPCYDPSNKLTEYIDKLPIDVLNKVEEGAILIG